MDNKDHIVLSCDTLGTALPEERQNQQKSSLTLAKDNKECEDEKVSHYNHCEYSSELIQPSGYVNYYDNKSYVLKQLKTEFPEDVLPQSDCGVDSKIHSENKELLKFVPKAEIKDENTEDGLSLNIKEENDYNEYQVNVKTERLEEQEDVKCEFYHNTLKNGCNLLQNSNKHVKVEINIPVDNGITELHQCQYCGEGFDNYNNMLVHISNDHKQENLKCDICGKQFKSVGNLNRHIMAFHKLDKPLESVNEDYVTFHVDFQHKYPPNDHSKLSCSGKEDGEDQRENKVISNITTYDYGTTLECRTGKQFLSPIHLTTNKSCNDRHNVQNANICKFQCDYCKIYYKTKTYLYSHIKRVHYDYGKQFDCWCGKQFRSPIHLRDHERQTHRHNVQNTNNDKFQCDYCKKLFTFKPNLARHIKAVHFDYRKKFACWCGKQFLLPIHLTAHKSCNHRDNVQNANICKFQCDYCKIYYKTKTYLYSHIKRVHYDYGKRFDCWCGKQFNSPIQLRDHKRLIHREY